MYVTENPHVLEGLTWPGVAWAFTSSAASNWHPVTWLSHMVDCQLYGLRPAGHHLTNVLLHSANTLLLFLILSRMTGAMWRSACVAALFAWHPLHVESVAWVAERKDVLSAFFFLLTLGAYDRYAEGRRKNAECRMQNTESRSTHPVSRFAFQASCYYLLSLLFFALGLMSKPMLVTLPFVLLLMDYWPLGRSAKCGARSAESGGPEVQRNAAGWTRLVAEKIPFLALSVLCCGATIWAQGRSYAIVSAAGLPLTRRIPHALIAYAHYIATMIVPRHLSVEVPYPSVTAAAEAVGTGAALALISFLAVRFAARRPYLLTGWCWYLGMLVPVIGLVQAGDQAWADRYTYLPLIGLFIVVVWGAGDLLGARSALRWLGAAVGLGLLAGTSAQLRHWRNTRTLFEHAVQVNPHNSRAIIVLGTLLAAEGKLEEAKGFYLRALSYRPGNPEAHFNLGRALDRQGKLEEAIAEYNRAVWFRPLQEQTHLLLGIALAKQGKPGEAATHYKAALAANPESADAENNLAKLLHTQGRFEEAIEHYSAALKIDPKLAQAHNNLGVVLLQQGRVAEGVTQLREAVRLRPGDPESEYNLGAALNQAERWDEAAGMLARLAQARPDDFKVRCQYGLALSHLQRTREAMSHYAHALLLQPDFTEALDGLAWILATTPQPEYRNGVEAVHMAERACDLTGRKEGKPLLTLAASYAEAGRFQEAVSAAEQAQVAATKAGQKDVAAKCQSLRTALQSGKPWRDVPPAR